MVKKNTKTKANDNLEATKQAKAPTTKAPPRQTKADAVTKKTSALDAAAKVLEQSGHAMTCQELIEAMAAKGL